MKESKKGSGWPLFSGLSKNESLRVERSLPSFFTGIQLDPIDKDYGLNCSPTLILESLSCHTLYAGWNNYGIRMKTSFSPG